MKLSLLLLLLSGSAKLFARQPPQEIMIKGVVVDSASSAPLAYATLILRNPEGLKPVKSMLTKDDGSFAFVVPLKQRYVLDLAYLGYRTKSVNVTTDSASGKQMADIGEIPMAALSGTLREVAITATRPILTKEIDRISFDVQADPESKSNDALEMLRKVPMITVDGNDIIQLKGSSNYVIFINGKPSALMTNNPSDVLKAMPAAVIKKNRSDYHTAFQI